MIKEELYENNNNGNIQRISCVEPSGKLIDLPKTIESMHVVSISEERKKKLQKKLSRSNSIGNVDGLLKLINDIQIESNEQMSQSVEDINYESLELPRRRRKSGMTLWRWSKTEKKMDEPKKASTRKKSIIMELGSKVGRRISLTIGDFFLNKRLSLPPERDAKVEMNGKAPELPPRVRKPTVTSCLNYSPESSFSSDTGESIGDQFEEDYLRPSSTHLDNETNGHEPMGIYCEPPIDFTKMQVARELVQRVISPQTSTSSRQQPSVPPPRPDKNMIRKELNEAFSKRLCGVEKTPTATPGTTPRHSSSSGGSSGDGTIRERRPLPPVPLPLWNHGSITRNEGIRRIENGQEGTYLFRNSDKQIYTLVVKGENQSVHNLRIRKVRNSYAIGEEKPNEELYETVEHIIEKYSSEDLKVNDSFVRLINCAQKPNDF